MISIEGRDLVGRRGAGDFSGIVFPYRWPGTAGSVLDRLRLDHPPVGPDGKVQHKYLSPRGARNRLYLPPCDASLLADVNLPIIITEGEKKVLALSARGARIGQRDGRTSVPTSGDCRCLELARHHRH